MKKSVRASGFLTGAFFFRTAKTAAATNAAKFPLWIEKFTVPGYNGKRETAVRLDIVPENIPAKKPYTSKGFTSAGQMDLRPELAEIPVFELFELNLKS